MDFLCSLLRVAVWILCLVIEKCSLYLRLQLQYCSLILSVIVIVIVAVTATQHIKRK